MIRLLSLSLSPSETLDEQFVKERVRKELSLTENDLLSVSVTRRSIDSRQRNILVNLELKVFVNESPAEEEISFKYRDVSIAKEVIIIGAGPAGLFAALRCLEMGLKPVLFERGKDVQSRRRDLARLNKEHIVDPESNYCFGEGGAGTYSDGKLYTRSKKRGDVLKVLRTLVYHGADRTILVDAHPHIGTNKLPGIITSIRQTIEKFGGEVHFQSKLTDIQLTGNKVRSLTIKDFSKNTDREVPCMHVILATGHSAEDIFHLLHAKKIEIEAKPFAMGVRVEHLQELIDRVQYHCVSTEDVNRIRGFLPASSYSIVHQVNGKGVYSFCMCPGGIIAPCATGPEQVVTNGWSPSKRNNPYANSGIVVSMDEKDWHSYFNPHKELAALTMQRELEKKAWLFGGKTQCAPAQRLQDFIDGKTSAGLPACSYQPGVQSMEMMDILGPTIGQCLKESFISFGKKMRGYLTNEAIIVGVESRTSTPVRIPRNNSTGEHITVKGLYPCGEGAGYAGGIVSAAMDGERCVDFIQNFL